MSAPQVPDPRPRVRAGAHPAVLGRRCGECRYPSLEILVRCPLCGGVMGEAEFGAAGTVFSSTVVRIPVAEQSPPFSLLYVDLDDGPRLLGHGRDREEVYSPGSRVALLGRTERGDPEFAEVRA